MFLENIDTGDLIDALYYRDLTGGQSRELAELTSYEDNFRYVREWFESNHNSTLEVLQDLLGMQHTTTKEQVIEQLIQIP